MIKIHAIVPNHPYTHWKHNLFLEQRKETKKETQPERATTTILRNQEINFSKSFFHSRQFNTNSWIFLCAHTAEVVEKTSPILCVVFVEIVPEEKLSFHHFHNLAFFFFVAYIGRHKFYCIIVSRFLHFGRNLHTVIFIFHVNYLCFVILKAPDQK